MLTIYKTGFRGRKINDTALKYVLFYNSTHWNSSYTDILSLELSGVIPTESGAFLDWLKKGGSRKGLTSP
jgi:hypothetical protein